MFKNSGTKLKSIAVIFFIISLIGFIALAFRLYTEPYRYNGLGFVFTSMLGFFVVLIVGIVFSYVECLFIYTVGDIWENTHQMAQRKSETNDNGRPPVIEEDSKEDDELPEI